jgi:hypothetical protein
MAYVTLSQASFSAVTFFRRLPAPLFMSALQLLRTCLGSHVRQTIFHGVARTPAVSTRSPHARSFASDKGKEKENATADVDEPKDEPAADTAAAAPKPEVDDVAAKLQAKQDEIVDLTVRVPSFLSNVEITEVLFPC